MDDEAETYKLWRIRKTVMQVSPALITSNLVSEQITHFVLFFLKLLIAVP